MFGVPSTTDSTSRVESLLSNAPLNTFHPGSGGACIDEVTLELLSIEQIRFSKFGKHVSFYRMAALGHPIENIVLENIGPSIDQVGKDLFRSWLFHEPFNPMFIVHADDSEPSRVFYFPQGKRSYATVTSMEFKHRFDAQ